LLIIRHKYTYCQILENHQIFCQRNEQINNTLISVNDFHETFDKIAPQTQNLDQINLDMIHNISPLPSNEDSTFLLIPFTIEEYNTAISSLKSRSAPGPDLISNKIIKNLPEVMHKLILKIFNLMYPEKIGIYVGGSQTCLYAHLVNKRQKLLSNEIEWLLCHIHPQTWEERLTQTYFFI